MPVPRRFDRRPPERDTTRINERIRVPEVRLIDDTGAQVGVMKTDQAVRFAQERDLDLVEVAPNARPPVCRVLDYSKYKYEQAQKQKSARKHQQQITIREIKFRPKIAEHDYETKKGHVERFLRHKDKVKITIMFRGREVTHPERGVMILDRLAEDLGELSQIEQRPIQDGRNMTMVLGPSKAVLADALEDEAGLDDADLDATHGEGEGEDPTLTLEGAAEVAEEDGSASEDQPLGDVTAVADEGTGEPGDADTPAQAPDPAIAEAAKLPQTTATKPAPKPKKPKGGRRSRDPEPQAEIEGDFTGLGTLPPPPDTEKAGY